MGSRGGLWALACAVALVGCTDRARPESVDGQLMALPKGLDFSRVALHGSRGLTVSLRNVGRGRIEVEELWLEDPAGSYRASLLHGGGSRSLDSGEGSDIGVLFAPSAAGAQPAFLVIRTDSLGAPQVRIPLEGVGVDARAVFAEEALDFGRIEVQARKALPLTLRNIGELPVEVGSRTVGPDGDEFDAPSLSLGPNEARQVDVVFHPSRVGKVQASLGITPCAGCSEVPVRLVAEALDQAVVADPREIDFGRAPADASVHRKVRLRNVSTEPALVTALRFSRETDACFSAAPVGFPLTLGPGEARELELRYGVSHEGPASGEALFDVRSLRNPTTAVALRGSGGAAELGVSPSAFDFGTVPTGAKAYTEVTVRNSGAGFPLIIQAVSIGGDGLPGEDEYSLAPLSLPRTLAPGEAATIKVFFEPLRDGPAAASLHLATTAWAGSDVRVGLSGRGRTYPGCAMRLTPGGLDFGTVPPGAGAVLGIRVANVGTEPCGVKNVRITDGTDAFSLPGGSIEGWPVGPGESFTFMVAVRTPAGVGPRLGVLQAESSDPENPRFLVPLRVDAEAPCLVATPPFLDFGLVRPDCPVAPLSVGLLNQCTQPVQLSGARIGPGTADGEFVLDDVSAPLPLTMAPGQGVRVRVKYLGQVGGMNLSPLYLDAGDLARPLLVPLVGESSLREEQVDRFVQQDGSRMDVLFVVDNSESMVDEQPRLLAALPAFADEVLRRGVDVHVGFTTTGIDPVSGACPGGAQGGEAGRLFPVDGSSPRILTRDTPDLASALQNDANVGLCAFLEQGLEASRRALSPPLVDHAKDPLTPTPNDGNLGFLREDAGLAVVFVGDEDDHSPDDVDTYVRFLRSVKGGDQPQRVAAYAIAPTGQACPSAAGTGTRYAEVALRTGGEVLDICATDYAPLLRDVADRVFSPQDRFPLTARPVDGSLRVWVDGVEQLSGWTYDALQDAVVFAPRPAAGAHIELHYRKLCGG